MYQDLPKHHDWPVEKAIDLLANQVKGKLLKHCKSEITKKGSKSSGDITWLKIAAPVEVLLKLLLVIKINDAASHSRETSKKTN